MWTAENFIIEGRRLYTVALHLKQGSPNYGPRAKSGPRNRFVKSEKYI